MKHCLYAGILLVFNTLIVSAQNSELLEEPDTVKTAKASLTLATIYANDVNYYGQSSADKLPYVLGNATLSFTSGFYFSASAYKLIDIGSGVSGVDLSAGYDFDLTKNLGGSVSFSRSFFPDSSLFLQSANLNMISGSLDYDWKWFNTGIYADYAIGDEDAWFLTFKASRLLDLGSLFNEKDYISFEPAFEVVGGNQSIITTEEIPANNGNNSSNGKGKGLGKIINLPVGKNKSPQYREIESTSFDLLSYNLKLPLAYNRASYAIEATYQGSVLSNKIEGASQKPRSFLYLGLYYIF
ncbi:MAG: hypothetical protein ACO1N7_01435 [Sphingobacteriaceae bacterium]